MSLPVFLAAITLGLASWCALLSTERARKNPLRGRLGGLLTIALATAATVLLARQWGLAVAVAAAVLCLMAGIPVVATVLGWQQGQERRHAG